jgi:hypothetical protein
MMHMAGFFPSVPTQVNFELAYAPVDRQWRLFGLSVSLGQAAPVAPPPPEPVPEAQLKGKAPPAAPQAHAAPLAAAPRAQAAPAKSSAPQVPAAPSAAPKVSDQAKQ